MKIVDCFMFYNEIDMLNFRLEYLYDTVDYFVLVEATHSHTGNDKPLYFKENKSKFSKFLDKIVHIVVDDMPQAIRSPNLLSLRKAKITLPQSRENHQRRCISRGISQLQLFPNDIIMISDVDEIPDRNTLKTINFEDHVIYSLIQDLYYYNLTTLSRNKWTYARIVNYFTYCKTPDPERIRQSSPDVLIMCGGWHFSYFGDAAFISNKLKNFFHTEYSTSEYTDIAKIQERIKIGKPVTNEETLHIPIEDNQYLPENYHRLI
jgi:beta-1,4-mannosyl-glycoprotein beta-1,4-N-acetylglucosaminyltransferase